jgi:hypothetical protein
MAEAPDVVPADSADRLAAMFQQAQVDYVPDPMVLRAADLFIGGKAFVPKIHPNPDIGLGEGAKITQAGVWATIDKNIDGLVAFFHLLMTRERVPLIDYDLTFNDANFRALGGIAVPLHPPLDIYLRFKKEAQDKIAAIDLARLPKEMVQDIAGELVSTGYGWLPDPGLNGLKAAERIAATFLMGGLIFGSYAAAIRGDHLLQTKRARLFAELTIEPEQEPQWGWQKESELFAQLDKIALRDPYVVEMRDRHLPPTVLTLLIEESKNPRDLLDKALKMREDDEWKDYRRWYAQLRKAWANGRHAGEEDDVQRATQEIAKRLARRQKQGEPVPLSEKEVSVKLKAEVGVEGPKVGIELDNAQNVRAPSWLRNWLVDAVSMRDHRKLLMRMALAQASYDNLTRGVKRVWEAPA